MISISRHLLTSNLVYEFGQKFIRAASTKVKPNEQVDTDETTTSATPATKTGAVTVPKKGNPPKKPDPPKKASPPKKAVSKKPTPPPQPKKVKPDPSKDSSTSRMKDIIIYRYDPNHPTLQFMQTFKFDLNRLIGSAPMVLTMLIMIKEHEDGTLAFRRSCREGICGSCGMNVNGINTLACISKVDMNPKKPMVIYPLPNMYVVKDLVVDLDHFYAQYTIIQPWLKRK